MNQPTIERVKSAYRNAENNPEIQSLLRDLYGDEIAADNRPVTERIKTFEDACAALGNHAYVNQYRRITEEQNPPMNETATDIIAYMKLRIIVAALNEGWEPEFVEGESRWAPWFSLCTNEEIENMDDDDRANICRVVGRSNDNAIAYGGLAYSNSSDDSSWAYSAYAARLAFKTEALAKYAGTQFIEIYRDFIIAR